MPDSIDRPIWIRPPSKGRCPHTSLGRSKFYQLISDGRVRSITLREPGSKKGVRLVELQSLLDYIESFGAGDGSAAK